MADFVKIPATTWKYRGGIRGSGKGWVAESYEAGMVKTSGHATKPEALAALTELVLQKLRDADAPWKILWCGDGMTALLVRPCWYSILKKTGEMGSCGTGHDFHSTLAAAIRHADQSYGGIEYPENHRTTGARQCRHCGRTIVNENGTWIDPEAPATPEDGDDYIWRETCDAHDTFMAEHEPADKETPDETAAQ